MVRKQQSKIQNLHVELELLNSDLALRKELTSDLEVQVQNLEEKLQAAEEEALGTAHKLNKEKKELANQVENRNCMVSFF